MSVPLSDCVAKPLFDDEAVSGSSEQAKASAPVFTGPAIVLEARSGWIPINWRELWRYRELLYFLTWRDVQVRYKQTVLGVAWALLQPLAGMLVFTLFFGRLASMPSDGLPYPIFVFAGLLPWTFFANSVTQASNSLVSSAALITKVYFPRLLVPTGAVIACLVDLLISLSVMGMMMAYYRVSPPLMILIVPLLIPLTVMAALGVGVWLSALTLAYRDFRFVIPFMVQMWMFCSPVVYPLSLVPENWQWVLALNPMTGILNAFRAALLGLPMPWAHLATAVVVSLVALSTGLAYFRRVERRFADIA